MTGVAYLLVDTRKNAAATPASFRAMLRCGDRIWGDDRGVIALVWIALGGVVLLLEPVHTWPYANGGEARNADATNEIWHHLVVPGALAARSRSWWDHTITIARASHR